MRITKISVKGLFGMFDHEIPLNQESRITLVHGPNGVGKSVMLHMLYGFLRHDLGIFRSTPFDQFRIDYQDGATFSIDKQECDATLIIQFVDGSGHETKSFEVEQPADEEQLADTDDPAWHNYRDISPHRIEIIDTFRLISSQYATHRSASDLDNTLVSASISDIEDTMRSVFSDLEWLGNFYRMLGVDDVPPYETFSNWLVVMKERIRPMREYFLSSFPEDEIERELNLFSVIEFYEIVNSRILFKEMDFWNGQMVFFNVEHDGGSNQIPLSALSSGEQHLLTLYYRLLFETDYASLVIIDEPEISMNVVWQRNFLKDLQRIVELRQFDVLIATHSPQIIHDKWDWVVHLGAKADD